MRRTWIAGAATTMLLAAGCAGGDGAAVDPADPVTIDITVTNATETYTVPWLVGMDQGFFTERGVRIGELVPGQGGSTTLRNLISGDLAIGEVSYPAVVDAAAEGTPVAAVGGAFQSLYGNDFYALSSNTAVQRIEDVRTWAFTNPGSVTESLTHLIPEAAGIGDRAVERVAAGGIGEGVALLESGAVDVAIVPDAVRAKNPDTFRLVVPTHTYIERFQQTVLTTTTDYAEDNPEVVSAVLGGYQESADWIHGHIDEAGALYAAHTDLPLESAVAAVRSAAELDTWSAGVSPEALDSAQRAVQLAGFEGEIPYCDLFDPTFLPEGTQFRLPVTC
ncbi:ABC transporter substrate-binding protein [Pseudonocardia sp. MH-G8]|uniref:ABC transporter substrate-binding protein n=1 Tax=Pseudonocardia sp. MH-G8 TaxID=1854588 RepID=UPI000BA094D3|nr:ABC transporter substrate-binding protein [Pseudonocardia sp. MH-G8]OZM78060.1 solute-binding protein [Pseudonocardia sp. MH-G8]